ncbi:MAG: filamentous hemagglutinin N-terminal domain-containing protein [Aquabacterium sp.]|jgi:filamentous hemagglutinin family protein|uniref:filamentous hemagglutinin N-terminal domain-containing protein n=1 Tax=Aquabacterium sp. TaxID=1872578 RepID=UPI003BB0A2ED
MIIGQPSRQVLRRAAIRARRLQRSLRRKGHGILLTKLALVVGWTMAGQVALANPTGGQVVAGSATIVDAGAGTLNVLQQSDRGIINWRSFSIGAGETVNFIQPSAGSVTLNRVLGNDPSAIFGRLNANGTVMLVNPNGIVFGAGSRVDVGGLVATTANIRDSDFMAGRYDFSQASANTNAIVENQGRISIRDSGLAALVAPRVRNSGVIEARLGRVALGAANTFSLDFHGDGLLSFGAGSAITETAPGSGALVTNSGEIRADGGTVLLTARAVKGVIDNVINTEGLISATAVASQGGRIVLSGGDAGTVAIGGRIDVSAAGGGQGGTVIATGEKVNVATGATIDASGRHGGGEIALGSTGLTDAANPFSSKSQSVSVAAGATLNADATESGKGGNVTLWSTDTTVFNGKISARGGAQGGDGGFAEVSSQKNIGITGDVDLRADKGQTGTFLIDPTDLRITDTNSGGTQDGNAGDGSVSAGDANQGAGNTLNTISRGLLESLSGNANIVLQATGQITIDAMAGGAINFATVAGRGVTLQSTQTGGIRFVDANTELRTQGGSITLEALGLGSSLSNIGRLTSNGGAVTLRATGNIQIAGAIDAGAGAVQMVSTVGSITNAGATAPTVSGSSVSLTAGGGHIGAAGSAINTHTARLAVEGGGDIFAASDMTLTDLSVNALHVAPGARTYQIDASGLTFTMADGSVLSAATIEQAGLNLTLLSDRSIELGTLDVGSGTLTVTSTAGNLVGAANNLSSAASVVLTARGSNGNNGAIGTSEQAINTATPTVSATSGTGGAYLANTGALNLALLNSTGSSAVSSTGTLTAGNVSTGSAALSLTSSAGSVVDDGNAATRIAAGSLTVNAAGAIGSSGTRLQTNASTLNANAASGGIHANTTATSSYLESIVSGDGAIDITVAGGTTLGAVTSTTSSLNNSITIATTGTGNMTVGNVDAGNAGNVSLSTTNGTIASSYGTNVNADKIIARAGGSGNASNITLRSSAARLDLENAGNITVTQVGSVTLDNVATTGNSISVTSSTGDITIADVRSSLTGSTTLSANGGAIIDDGNSNTRLITGSATLNAAQSIGTSANPIQASIYGLTVNNTGNVYLVNTDNTLTSLSVTNRHATPGVANVLEITSPFLTFDVTDDGSQYAINRIVGVPLNSLLFSGDQTAVIGQVQAVNGSVSLIATQGDLVEDGNTDTRVTGSSVVLSAYQGNVGSVLAPLEVNTSQLTLGTRGDLYVNSIADLSNLTISSSHADSTTAYGLVVKAPSLAFTITDSAAGHHVQNVVDSSGLSFSFTSDRDITLGQVDVSYGGSVSFNSTGGSILDDGDKTTHVLANSTILYGQVIGASGSDHLDVITGSLYASADTGGVYIDLPTATGGSYTNTLTLTGVSSGGPVQIALQEGDIVISGDIYAFNQAVSLTSYRGAILNPSGTVYVGNGSLTLSAAGSIGNSSRALTLYAYGAELDAQAGTGITVSSDGSLILGTVNATPGGAVSITSTSGSLLDDGDAATGITGSQVNLSAAYGELGGSGTALSVDTTRLSLTAQGTVAVNNGATLTELNLSRTGGSYGTVDITAGAGQTFNISGSNDNHTLTEVSSTSPLAFGFSGTGLVSVGTIDVGTAGKASVTSTGGSIANIDTDSSITAGTVALAAGTGGSIGTSTSAIDLRGTTDLSLTAGRNVHVDTDVALAKLAIQSTNSTTAIGTASQFGITAAGQTFGITDSGTTQSLNFAGTSLGDFSFINSKNIEVGALAATGGITLSTSGGGVNSNISSDAGAGRISANSVTLNAASTTAGGGNIGTAGNFLRVATPSLTLVGSGNMLVADSQSLSTLDMMVTHGRVNTTYSYAISASNLTNFSLNDGDIQTLSLTASTALDFRYSADRALWTNTITTGTNSTGSVSLTSRSAPTGTAPQIIRGGGNITAGSVSLSAVGTNGSVNATTNTRHLSVASGGNVNVSNDGTTLQSLSLDLQHRTSGSSTHSYSIANAGGGFTFDVSDNSNTGLMLNNVAQAGMDLSIKSDRTIIVKNVNVGSGSVTLSSTNSAGVANGSILGESNASAGNPAITAGHLLLNAGSVYRYQDGSNPLYTSVDSLSSKITSSLYVSNNKSLTLRDNSVGSSAHVKTSAGSILQGANALFVAPNLTLTSNQAIGATGAPSNSVQTDARQLVLSAGRDIVVNNASDLFSLDITSTHAAVGTQNTVSVTADRLDLLVTDSIGGNQYTLDRITDFSGINFSLRTDVDLVVGTADVKAGHHLTLDSAGVNTSITNNGSSTLKGNSITLSATGSVGATGDDTTRMQTDARSLTVNTGANAFVDNARDLLDLSFRSAQTPNGVAPTYSVTAPELTFDITSDGFDTTVNQIHDTTGLNFALNTNQRQVIDVVDVQKTGTVSLTTYRDLLASSNPSHHITAANTTLATANYGSGTGGTIGAAGNEIQLSSPLLTVNSTGSVYIDSDTHIDRLAINATHPVATTATYAIQSVPVLGTAPYSLLSGTDSDAGSVLTSLNDTQGLTFSFDSDRAIAVGDLDLGTTGSVALSNRGGSNGIMGDGVAGTQIQAASLTMSSSGGAIGAAGAGNSIEATVASLSATSNGGATYLNLHGRTSVSGVNANGDVNLVNDIGDIALGNIDARGNAVNINNLGGSILSGSISRTTNVSLTANGSIGNQSAVTLSASGGTTTLTASAAAAYGAAGSINISESYALTAASVTAPGAVTLQAGNNLSAGVISSNDAVKLTSSNGSITALNGSNLTSGTSVAMTAASHIGANGAPLRVSTKNLALQNVGDLYIEGQQDLDSLSINRANNLGATSSNGVFNLSASNLTFSGADTGGMSVLSSLVDTTGLDFSFRAISPIRVGGIDVGAGSVTLYSSVSGGNGAITALNGSSRITAGSASLTAIGTDSVIGASGLALGLAVGTLTASSGTGGIYLTQAGSLNLSNLSTTGNLTVTATAGDLTLGTMSYGANSELRLTASVGSILAGNVTLSGTGANSSIYLTAANGIGTELAPIIVNGNAGNSVSATVTGAGSLYLSSTGSLAGGLTTSVANGSTNVTAAGDIVLTSMTSGTDAVGNDINVTASAGNITVKNVSAGADARYSGVNLSANAGSILADGAGTVTGYDLNLFGANGVGTNSNRVVVNGQRVSVTTNGGAAYLGTSGASVLTNVATNGGAINVNTAHDLLIANATSGGGAITINGTAANVDLIAGNINAGSGNVSLISNSAGGTVQDDGSVLTRITGNTVTLQGAGGVGSALMAMQTTASTLALSDAAGGVGIYVNDNNTNGLTLSSVTAGGGAIVINAAGPLTATSVAATADSVGNNVTLTTSNGGITVGSVSAGANNGAVVLNSAGAIVASGSGTNITAHSAQLTADGNIGVVTNLATGAGTPLLVNVSQLDSLTATGANRVVSINNVNTGTWTVGAAGLTMGTGGSAYLRSAGNLDVSAATLPQGGNLLLSAAGTLTLPTAGLSTTGALSLTGGTDVVTTASGAAARDLTLSGDTVYVRSGSAGGNTVLTTTTDTLDAALTGAGALTVNNTGTLTQTTLQTSNGNITATSSTGMTAQSVVAGGANRTVSLTATTGDLTTSLVNAGANGTISLNAAAGQLFTVSSSLTASELNLTSGAGIGSSTSAFDATGMTVNATVTGVGDIYLTSTGLLTTGTLTTTDGSIDVATTGNLNASGAITAGQGGDVSLASGNGTVTVTQAFTSQGNLTVEGQQIVLNGGSVNTSGTQHYTGAVVLGADTTLMASALTVDGTVNGAQALTVNANTGDVAFNDAVGGTTRLGALVVNTAGETKFGAVRAASVLTDDPGTVVLTGDVNTTGTQTYGELVTLAANVTLTGATVSMANGVDASTDGGQSLTVQGNAVLGNVGDNYALSSLTVNGASTLSGPAVNTTGAQNYNGALTLDADVVLEGGSLAFNGTVDGAHALTVNAGSGDVAFDYAVGGTTRLGALTVNTSGETRFTSVRAASVTTDGPGTVVLAGNVNTTGTQTYGELVTLAANVTLTGTTVSLAGGVDASMAGGQSLTVQGDAVLGTVGDNYALSSLTVNGASTLNGAVATTGGQTYDGAITLGADITLSGDTLVFNGTIDGAYALTVEAGSSDVVIDHAVGGTTRLGALTINTAGETRLNAAVHAASIETDTAGTVVLANTVNTTGTQTYGERVTLAANVTLTGSTVSLLNGVDATTAGGESLAIQGNAVLGDVGGTQALSSLNVSGITTLEGTSVSTTGSQTYSGALTLADDATLHSTDGSLVFGSTVDGPASNTLTLRADVGDIDAAGAVRIGNLVSSADGGTTRFRGTLTAEDIGGLQLSGMGFVFEGAVAASTGALSIANTSASGTTSFTPGATVQAATGFTQTGGAAVYLPATVRVTSGPISLEAPAYLPGGSAELSTNGDITLTGLIGRNTSLVMTAGPTGVLTIGRDDAVAEHKLDLGRLRVSSAVSAQMFGRIGGRTGAMAAADIAGGLVNAPYYMNGTPWGPIDLIGSLAASTLPGNVIPSMPRVGALFTGNFSTTGLSPDALGVFKDPVVLTVASVNLQNNGVLAPITDERDAAEPAVR